MDLPSRECSVVYDFDLHMRFLKNATEAWFNYASAGAAACGAWQDKLENAPAAAAPPSSAVPVNPFSWWMDMVMPREAAPVAKPAPAANPFTWWMDAFTPRPVAQAAAALPVGLPDFGSGFFQFAQPFAAFTPGAQTSSPFSPSHAMNAANGFADMMQACGFAWPRASWNMFQTPMTAWLMSSGLPYAVAAPTARANAASMEAADAAREGFNRVFSSFRTDGGHASASVSVMNTLPKFIMLFLAPWLMFSMPGLAG